MGQKVNPNGLRLGINKDWEAKWYIMTYITPSDVQSITWHGTTIYEAE